LCKYGWLTGRKEWSAQTNEIFDELFDRAKKVMRDNGKQFTSKIFKGFLEHNNIKDKRIPNISSSAVCVFICVKSRRVRAVYQDNSELSGRYKNWPRFTMNPDLISIAC
jgi:hypothetical protein